MNNRTPTQLDILLQYAYRLIAWGMLAAIIYFLKSFFLLIFLTFVFSYIQTKSVNRIEMFIKYRTACVYVVAFCFLCIMTGVGLFIVPEVKKQSESFIRQFGTYVARVDQEIITFSNRHTILQDAILKLKDKSTGMDGGGDSNPLTFSPTATIFQQVIGMGEETEGPNITQIIDTAQNIGKRVIGIASAFILSLIFSFLIVLDLPNLTEHVKSIGQTRLKFFFEEVAGGIYNFSRVLGQAFEAQFFIAMINSLLTAVGMAVIGLGNHMAFLSMIVFLCSFIPVAGVFISSIPICLIALQLKGLNTMFIAVFMIIITHLIEGYILNPRIYGARMKINPVIVLLILTIAGKMFHTWGLILGVPVFSYVFGHAIQFPENRKT